MLGGFRSEFEGEVIDENPKPSSETQVSCQSPSGICRRQSGTAAIMFLQPAFRIDDFVRMYAMVVEILHARLSLPPYLVPLTT